MAGCGCNEAMRWVDARAHKTGLKELTTPTIQVWYRERPIAVETGLFVSFWSASLPAHPNIKHRRWRAAFGERQGQSGLEGYVPLIFDLSCPMRQADAAEPTGFFCSSSYSLPLLDQIEALNQSINQSICSQSLLAGSLLHMSSPSPSSHHHHRTSHHHTLH